ncbi:WD40 repeat-like protein [Delitschia confertaspora ATCC 74209]|uniref:WD40 repeat-like protein n=1 Tax=Delitschia confertaspora ATCC 74209 TaxID=1513339 RepID=A0A9P4JWH6_9PLEO|nr:WD40 repeat-like protein [Delitschia confertaspora ATCC 74209]
MEVPRDGIRRDLSLIEQPKEVTRDDLDGDRCDIQGINWEKLGLSREWVRTKRSKFESDKRLKERLNPPAHRVPNCENYYSFVRNNTTHRAHYSHFQLRNLLAATSTNDIYYATKQKVMWTDGYGGPATCVMDLSSEVFDGHKPLLTTLGASEELVIAGGFSGEYAMTNLRSEFGTPPVLGRATEEQSGITNHIHTFPSRAGGATQAAFCSNDKVLRVLDCHTNTFTHSSHYTKPINCSATSPNGRMRAVVGDFPQTLITNAETGEPLEALTAHQDDVFSVAWADDGIHVATSAQDCRVVVWDARNWRSPLAVMESELAIPRSLRFSPVGGGPRVLISAEADDFVNVIDAVSWDKRQVIDTFGTIAGIAIAPDGSDLFVANSDYRFGGLMRFERGDHWSRGSRSPTRREMSDDEDEQSFLGIEEAEWESEGEMEKNRRVVGCRGGAARRGLGLGGREWLC